jgi:CRP/FNR family transcriptional regulator, cyclic AMP receptor protein
MADVVPSLKGVPLFSGVRDRELKRLANVMRESRFNEGDVIATEGRSGIGFFLIEEGNASVSLHGEIIRTLGPGDHFGEIALIDEGERMATITAATDLVCHGLTYWEFRPLVQENGTIGWKLLQSMAGMLRDAQHEH